MKTVLIKDLAVAEKIVKNNYQLHWDGWDIVHTRPDPEAFKKPNGVFRDGRWHYKTTIALKRAGWYVPKDYIC